MKKERTLLFDNAKALLMVTVVFGHALSDFIEEEVLYSLFSFIYAFHMPLFIFLSGYFHKNGKIKGKALFYFLLGFLVNILIFIVKKVFLQTGSLSLFAGGGVCWFMFALCAFTVLTYLFKDSDLRVIFVISVIIGLFSGYDPSIGDELFLSRILVFYPFYLLGVLLQKSRSFKALILPESRKIKVLQALFGIAVIIIWLRFCFLNPEEAMDLKRIFTGRHPFNNLQRESMLGFLLRGKCYLISLITSLAVLFLMPDKKIPLFTRIGQNSLSVFFWHRPIVLLCSFYGMFALFIKMHGTVLWFILYSAALSLLLSFSIKPLYFIKKSVFKQKGEKMKKYILKRFEVTCTQENTKDWTLEQFKTEAMRDFSPFEIDEFDDLDTALKTLNKADNAVWDEEGKVPVTKVGLCGLEIYEKDEEGNWKEESQILFPAVKDLRRE